MVFERGWRQWLAAEFWHRAARRAASVYRRKGTDRLENPAQTRVQVAANLIKLTQRADFLRVSAAGRRVSRSSFVVQAAPQSTGPGRPADIRVGFTASRKVGNSVARNRAKRRMRAAAFTILPSWGSPGTDYVLIARPNTVDLPFSTLLSDLVSALRRILKDAAATAMERGSAPALGNSNQPTRRSRAKASSPHQPASKLH